MTEIKEIIIATNTGYQLVKRVHWYYTNAGNSFVFRPFYFLIFIFLFPFLSVLFLLLNYSLSRLSKKPIVIEAENYAPLKRQHEKMTGYVNYFHIFFNADTRTLSFFVRPLFPLIKRHIRLQADYRVVLHLALLELNAAVSGTHFVFLKEAELWDYRNKAYNYLA